MLKFACIDATQGNEEDFSWEEDDEDEKEDDDEDEHSASTASTTAAAPPASAIPSTLSKPAIHAVSSPRLSSEASYDVVGEKSAVATRDQSPAATPVAATPAEKEKVETANDDEEGEDDEDDDEDGDESDWE